MKRALLNLTCFGLGVMLTLGPAQWLPSYGKSERTPPKVVVQDSPVNRDARIASSFAPIIKKAAPSVVNIYTTKVIKERDMRMHPFFNDPSFREFFGIDPEQFRPRNRREQSLGSGVIVSADGYLLTSNHVIEGADEIRVVLASGREFTAEVIGNDPATDTAVIKVNATELPAITLANSDNLEVGDVVLAIGNPFGIGQTVTMGIVSGVGRSELGIVAYEDFIQTDASINPGNSGGALVDAEGRLIGINTAILSRTGGNQGVGFAIPINMGRHVMDRLITEGKVSRGYLGIGIQALNQDFAREFGLADTAGALVTGVEQGTPAEKAGLQAGDVILEVNGKKVNNDRHLRLMVSQTAPGTDVTLKVVREGKPKEFKMKLAELPSDMLAGGSRRSAEPDQGENETLEGVEVADLDAKTRRQFNNIPAHIRGAVVTNVDPDSKAYDAGLRPGDVILEMDRKPVTTAEQAVELSEKFKGDRILLRVWSRGASRYLFVENGRNKPKEEEKEEK